MLRDQESFCTSCTQATSAVKRLDLREYFCHETEAMSREENTDKCMFCSEHGLSTDTYAVDELLKVEY